VEAPFDLRSILMCPPDHFDVVDVKNPHMEGKLGTVDTGRARAQWEALKRAFEAEGVPVATLPPIEGCEDMVFAANQTFPGIDAEGRRICILSRMKHASRQREVPGYARWFADHGYQVAEPIPPGCLFEGCGDAIWHPGRRLIWAGYGHRSEREAHTVLAEWFDATVRILRLVDPHFYHLDTCLCPLDERAALYCPDAFEPQGVELLRDGFDELIAVDLDEAVRALGCNGTALPNGAVVIEQRAERTIARLTAAGYRPVPVDTGEFLKSGGSVFCMKQFVY
jgi:N-dimethylarginine dimethylaminohydrolase